MKRKPNDVERNVSTAPDTISNEETSVLNCVEETVNVAAVNTTFNLSSIDDEAATISRTDTISELRNDPGPWGNLSKNQIDELIIRGPPAISDNFDYAVNDVSNRRFNPSLCC